jgi:hypothetical protein
MSSQISNQCNHATEIGAHPVWQPGIGFPMAPECFTRILGSCSIYPTTTSGNKFTRCTRFEFKPVCCAGQPPFATFATFVTRFAVLFFKDRNHASNYTSTVHTKLFGGLNENRTRPYGVTGHYTNRYTMRPKTYYKIYCYYS